MTPPCAVRAPPGPAAGSVSSPQCLRGWGVASGSGRDLALGEGRVHMPHCLRLACPEGGGWALGTELGLRSLTSLTPNAFLMLRARLLWGPQVWSPASCG